MNGNQKFIRSRFAKYPVMFERSTEVNSTELCVLAVNNTKRFLIRFLYQGPFYPLIYPLFHIGIKVFPHFPKSDNDTDYMFEVHFVGWKIQCSNHYEESSTEDPYLIYDYGHQNLTIEIKVWDVFFSNFNMAYYQINYNEIKFLSDLSTIRPKNMVMKRFDQVDQIKIYNIRDLGLLIKIPSDSHRIINLFKPEISYIYTCLVHGKKTTYRQHKYRHITLFIDFYSFKICGNRGELTIYQPLDYEFIQQCLMNVQGVKTISNDSFWLHYAIFGD
ncbi:hypothetical protein RF11_13893 [Thelohanellus kitauei]|uniref:Uncharacterized protein n=1 Tax=Thelohanellus kitauei TaxID=669202 RepID=A0A0C2M1G7_THEKT|nr:hypothetical protein RF11_13893 [Thelohanellus kitauei]